MHAERIATATHPHEATVTGSFVYYGLRGGEAGRVPFAITVGDNCCDEHARLAARRIAGIAAKDRHALEQGRSGLRVEAEFDDA